MSKVARKRSLGFYFGVIAAICALAAVICCVLFTDVLGVEYGWSILLCFLSGIAIFVVCALIDREGGFLLAYLLYLVAFFLFGYLNMELIADTFTSLDSEGFDVAFLLTMIFTILTIVIGMLSVCFSKRKQTV